MSRGADRLESSRGRWRYSDPHAILAEQTYVPVRWNSGAKGELCLLVQLWWQSRQPLRCFLCNSSSFAAKHLLVGRAWALLGSQRRRARCAAGIQLGAALVDGAQPRRSQVHHAEVHDGSSLRLIDLK
jgi:hypothetical protein